MGKSRTAYVFPGANTAVGYHSFFLSGLSGLDNIFILKGGPGCGKSTLMRRINRMMTEKGLETEVWQCSSDMDSLDGVLIPRLSAAVIDGTPPHVVEPSYPGAVEELVDLGQCWRAAELKRQRARIMELSRQSRGKYRQCREYLAQASRLLRDGAQPGGLTDGPAAAIPDMAMGTAPDAAYREQDPSFAHLSGRVFGRHSPVCRHLFAASVTPQGWVSFLEPLSGRAGRRLILTGPFGQGKEELMRRLAAEAGSRRLYAEAYHHPLALEALQMLWLPDLDTAVLALEEAPPGREGDEIIPCGRTEDEESAREQRQEIRRLTALAGEQVAQAKALHDELEACYAPAMDYSLVEEAGARLLARLLALPLLEA